MCKPMAIGACGPTFALRYFIVDQDSNYWTEGGWTRNRREAGLFADMVSVSRKMHDLMLAQVPGTLVRYTAPVTVEVKATDPVTLAALRDWLEKAVQMFLDATHGTGPGPDAMVMMNVDWERLREKKS